ncbi:VCBS repeat-containing protein [Pedobacter deserti]|uniref:VCBS repeat-containing protein n=1 Tax=Pedobacter deserti TaxID=2817382 RepID=UPI002109B291|nr:VCBS repeat-containing protein [Pedobacter sp. SYSU D00382]
MTLFRLAILCALFLLSCAETEKTAQTHVSPKPRFKLLDSSSTSILFNNVIQEKFGKEVTSFYQGFYNGGGVATGDLNGDGLDDIYFSGNMVSNKLYLNHGNMRFSDITRKAGVGGRLSGWRNGVNMADVNGDGKLDIYVCHAGRVAGPRSRNQLFINQGLNSDGIPTFADEALTYGLADTAFSTQSIFFDYDLDGDLDLFLINENIQVLSNLDDVAIEALKKQADPLSCSKLYKNEGQRFREVTKEAGLNMSTLSYGLSGGVGDINNDGWPDIYLSNDYAIPDVLYINNGDGTFSDQMQKQLDHISLFSMGNCIADVNNDGLQDIFTLDMLPEDNKRQKLLAGLDNYELFNINLRNGFYYQYMRNMLHINNGNGTFSEIGQLAGVSNTDWSWAPLFADYDNDGWKDLFVTNGYMRDFTNQDVLKYNEQYMQSIQGQIQPHHLEEMLKRVPSSDVKNYIFRNNGNLTFSNKGAEWGITLPSNSNGAAYSDLDNDGDLDIVVNNINKAAFIYENQGDTTSSYLKVKLKGSGKNTDGLGATVTIYQKGRQQCLEQMPSRGFLSSVSANLHFGLGNAKTVDSVRVVWPGGRQQVLSNIRANMQLLLYERDATQRYVRQKSPDPLFKEISSPIAYSQKKNHINDFKRQPNLVNALSFSGPCMARGDLNGDSLEDLFIGGDVDQPGAVFIQQRNGQFRADSQPFLADVASEDTDAVFFDANGDTHTDLYVVSGGYGNFKEGDSLFQDRLYLNDGKGRLTKAAAALPKMHSSKSCARVGDFNGDGKPDLFVGSRVKPTRYPETPASYLLINDGKGRFTNQIRKMAAQLEHIGMVTDAAVTDLNQDGRDDLIVVGDWMPVTAFLNEGGQLKNQTKQYFGKSYQGWWNTIQLEDLNADGRADLVLGNLGLNSQCRVSDAKPAEMFYKDFDMNGAMDPILCFYLLDKSYPYMSRDELLDQMSIMRPRFPDYKSYSEAGLKEMFTPDELEGARRLKANCLKTSFFIRQQNGRFKEKALPIQAQFAPVFTITSLDYDSDGYKDLLLCGNINQSRIRFGKYDANHGILLKGNGKGDFSYVPELQSGLRLKGDVRSTAIINNTLFVGINQQKLRAFRFGSGK